MVFGGFNADVAGSIAERAASTLPEPPGFLEELGGELFEFGIDLAKDTARDWINTKLGLDKPARPAITQPIAPQPTPTPDGPGGNDQVRNNPEATGGRSGDFGDVGPIALLALLIWAIAK